MLTTIETLRPPILCSVITIEPTDAPEYRSPWDLVGSVVYAFRRDARYLGLGEGVHVEGWNNGNRFYLETWRSK